MITYNGQLLNIQRSEAENGQKISPIAGSILQVIHCLLDLDQIQGQFIIYIRMHGYNSANNCLAAFCQCYIII